MKSSESFNWDIDIKLLTNRYIMGEVFKVLGIAAFIVAAFVGLLTLIQNSRSNLFIQPSSNAQGFKYMFILLVVVFAFTALFILVFYSNKYELTYIIDKKGVLLKTRQKQRNKNNILNVVLSIFGLLAKNFSAAGIGVMMRGHQDMLMKWKGVRKIVYVRKHATIVLKDSFGIKILVFCMHDNKDAVYRAVCSFCSNIEPVVKEYGGIKDEQMHQMRK